MSTVGYVSTQVLHQMREFSNSGDITTIADNKDYLLSIIPAINDFQRMLATTSHKIQRKHEIAQNNPDNLLGNDLWYEDQVHTDEDVTYIATGARTYSFEVDGDWTVYIEEETATDVWTINVTLSGSATDGIGYVNYKGFTGITDTSNRVRIRFSGDYRYLYRYIGLFSDNYATEAQTPQYRPYVPYDMPTTFYKKNRIDATYANAQFSDVTDYRFETYDKSLKRLFLPWGAKGNFVVHYYAYPAVIPDPDPNNVTENDNIELDIAEECIPVIINKIAAMLMRDENPYISDTFNVEYYQSKNEIDSATDYEQGRQDIVSNSNW